MKTFLCMLALAAPMFLQGQKIEIDSIAINPVFVFIEDFNVTVAPEQSSAAVAQEPTKSTSTFDEIIDTIKSLAGAIDAKDAARKYFEIYSVELTRLLDIPAKEGSSNKEGVFVCDANKLKDLLIDCLIENLRLRSLEIALMQSALPKEVVNALESSSSDAFMKTLGSLESQQSFSVVLDERGVLVSIEGQGAQEVITPIAEMVVAVLDGMSNVLRTHLGLVI